MEIAILILLILIFLSSVSTLIFVLLIGSAVVQVMEALRQPPEKPRKEPMDKPWYTDKTL